MKTEYIMGLAALALVGLSKAKSTPGQTPLIQSDPEQQLTPNVVTASAMKSIGFKTNPTILSDWTKATSVGQYYYGSDNAIMQVVRADSRGIVGKTAEELAFDKGVNLSMTAEQYAQALGGYTPQANISVTSDNFQTNTNSAQTIYGSTTTKYGFPNKNWRLPW